MPRSIIGSDDRTAVGDPTSFPFRTVCKVFTYWPNGTTSTASAVLVARNLALTAGHVVFDPAAGGWADDVEIVPGYDDGFEPFGHYFADTFHSLSAWTDLGDSLRDFGALQFQFDRPGNATGWLGYRTSYYDTSITDSIVNTAGYPGDRDSGERMYFASGLVDEVGSNVLVYSDTLDTYAGQSGSAIWAYSPSDNGRYVIAIHTTGLASIGSNVATRITPDLYRLINLWRSGRSERIRWLPDNGRIVLRNRSWTHAVDVWFDAENDEDAETFVATLPPRGKFTLTQLPRDRLYRFVFDESRDGSIDEGATVLLRGVRRTINYLP